MRRLPGLLLALGADAANLLRLVILRGMRLTAGGVLFGAVAGIALTRLMGRLLYNISPQDPRAFGFALAVMTTTAIGACLRPRPGVARLVAIRERGRFDHEDLTARGSIDPEVKAKKPVLPTIAASRHVYLYYLWPPI